MISSSGWTSRTGANSSPSSRRISSSAARVAMARIGWASTVSGGSSSSAQSRIVDGDDRDVVGHPQPAVADSLHARPAPSGCWPRSARWADLGRPSSSVTAVPGRVPAESAVGQDPAQARRLDRGQVALLPLAAGLDLGPAADEGDAPVPGVDQPLGRGPHRRARCRPRSGRCVACVSARSMVTTGMPRSRSWSMLPSGSDGDSTMPLTRSSASIRRQAACRSPSSSVLQTRTR